jgi:MinD superfamily P-loop ATPase
VKDNAKMKWEVEAVKCTGCGDCVILCPVKALKIVKKVAALADAKSCCGASCRICEYHCSQEAIRAY